MSAKTLSFQKVTAIPSVIAPDTVYFVLEAGKPVSLFVSNEAGDTLHPVGNSSSGSSELDPFLLMGAFNG